MDRRLLLAIAAGLALTPGLALASEGLQRTFAERSALLATDARCGLLEAPVRSALMAGAAQARGALLRAGWTNDSVTRLSGRAAALTANRACDDPAVTAAAQSARAGFAGYSRLFSMQFPGGERQWTARRRADASGWLAFQDLENGARFGVKASPEGYDAAFSVPVSGVDAPFAARLILRDPVRAPASPLDIPGRTATGLRQNTPPPAMATHVLAKGRALSAAPERTVTFSFPTDALARIARLDPREAAVLEVDGAAGSRRFLLEIGDLAAALAFLDAGR